MNVGAIERDRSSLLWSVWVRTGERDKHLPHRLAAEVECADALTRLLIYAGFRGFDLDGAVAEKRAYNAEREDHKPENRRKEGGKAF